jgi:hypothetical protein
MKTTGELNINLNPNTLQKVLKDYKKIKKYMRSSIYEVQRLDGNENVVTKLIDRLDKM